MSTEYDEYDDLDASELPKKLRAKIKELQKENDELNARFNEINAENRKRTLSEALGAKGYNPKIAAFIPAEVESQEGLHEWLEEYGDVFGGQQAAAAVEPQNAAAVRQMDAAESGAPSNTPVPADIMSQIDNAENMEELMRVLGQ